VNVAGVAADGNWKNPQNGRRSQKKTSVRFFGVLLCHPDGIDKYRQHCSQLVHARGLTTLLVGPRLAHFLNFDSSSCFSQTLFGSTLYKEGSGEVGTKAVLKGKTHVGIFFGAAWSGSCKQFLLPLVQVYKKLIEEKGEKRILETRAKKHAFPLQQPATFERIRTFRTEMLAVIRAAQRDSFAPGRICDLGTFLAILAP
jgi:hypothetical protein